MEATANVYFDNGTGQIDYTTPLNPVPIPIWPCRQDKAGFGMAQFGAGDFGYDSAACGRLRQGQLRPRANSASTPIRSNGSARHCRLAGTGLASRSPMRSGNESLASETTADHRCAGGQTGCRS